MEVYVERDVRAVQGALDFADRWVSEEYEIIGGDYANWRLDVKLVGPNEATVKSTVDITPGEIRNMSGEVLERYEAVHDSVVVYTVLRGGDGRWIITHG